MGKKNDSKRDEIINLMLDKLSLKGQSTTLVKVTLSNWKWRNRKVGSMPPINYFQFSVSLTMLSISILYKF